MKRLKNSTYIFLTITLTIACAGCAGGNFKPTSSGNDDSAGGSGGSGGLIQMGGQGGNPVGMEEFGGSGGTINFVEECIRETFQVDETKVLFEICDEIDNDCDGKIDEGILGQYPLIEGRPALTVAPDCDRDNFPIGAINVTSCFPPGEPGVDDIPIYSIPIEDFCENGQYVASNLPDDCNDEDPDINPFDRTVDICGDGIDNDCDGRIDNEPNYQIIEICDAIDNNCDGRINESPEEIRAQGNQGLGTSEANSEILLIDCDNDDYGVSLNHQSAVARTCTRNGREFITYDGISLPCPNAQWIRKTVNNTPEDCNDLDPNIHPHADERCNGHDNDCDDQIGEDLNRDLFSVSRIYPDCDGDSFSALGASSVLACRNIEGGPLVYPYASPVELGYCPPVTRDSASWTSTTPIDSDQNPTFDCNDLRYDEESVATQIYIADCDGDGFTPAESDATTIILTSGDNCGRAEISMSDEHQPDVCGSEYRGSGSAKWVATRSAQIDCWDFDPRVYQESTLFSRNEISSYRSPVTQDIIYPQDESVRPFDFNCDGREEGIINQNTRTNLRNPISGLGPEHWCPVVGEPEPIPDEIAANPFLSTPLDVCTVNEFGTCVENPGWCNDSRGCGLNPGGPAWVCNDQCFPEINWNYILRCR